MYHLLYISVQQIFCIMSQLTFAIHCLVLQSISSAGPVLLIGHAGPIIGGIVGPVVAIAVVCLALIVVVLIVIRVLRQKSVPGTPVYCF